MHEARRHKIPGKLLRSPAPGSHFVYLSAQEKWNFMGELLRGGGGGGGGYSHMKWTGINFGIAPGGGGVLPYEMDGDKFRILVSLRVFWAKCHIF